MANNVSYKDLSFAVGDTIRLNYRIKEDDKERLQLFEGILIKISGANPDIRMITLRKMTRSGIGVERVIPLSSPFIQDIQLVRKSNFSKSKLYFIRNLSDQQLRSKLYHKVKVSVKKKAVTPKKAVVKKPTKAS